MHFTQDLIDANKSLALCAKNNEVSLDSLVLFAYQLEAKLKHTARWQWIIENMHKWLKTEALFDPGRAEAFGKIEDIVRRVYNKGREGWSEPDEDSGEGLSVWTESKAGEILAVVEGKDCA
jgi:hypothetical protein